MQNKGFIVGFDLIQRELNHPCEADASMSDVWLKSAEQQVKKERRAGSRRQQRQTEPMRTNWNPHQPLTPLWASNFSDGSDTQKKLELISWSCTRSWPGVTDP